MPIFTNASYESIRFRRARLSRHARKRSQQRAIAFDAVPLIKAYGEISFDGHGGTRYAMTVQAMANLVKAVGRTKEIERLAGTYIVVDAETQSEVITISHIH